MYIVGKIWLVDVQHKNAKEVVATGKSQGHRVAICPHCSPPLLNLHRGRPWEWG